MDNVTRTRLQRLLVIGVVALVGFVGVGMLLLSQLVHYINKPSPAAETTGKIYVTRPAARKQAAQCAVIFEAGGKKYENYGTGCSWYESGDDVTILYNPNDPTKAALDARNVGYVFGGGGVFILLLAYWLIQNYRSKLRKGG